MKFQRPKENSFHITIIIDDALYVMACARNLFEDTYERKIGVYMWKHEVNFFRHVKLIPSIWELLNVLKNMKNNIENTKELCSK